MRRLSVALLALMMPVVALAQFPRPNIPGIEIPGLDKLLKQEPALATSLADARTEVPFLDGFDPRAPRRLSLLPRGPNGGFLLTHAGTFEYHALSYCLNAGMYGPGGGDGYLYAPLRGSLAGIVQSVLHNSIDHPDIAQSDIQELLWAILARSGIKQLPARVQAAAAQLLTPEEIGRLDTGALGLLPEAAREAAFARLPPLVRQALEAEARLREMLTSPGTTFAELEQVAVLTGEPEPGQGSREVLLGRWSYQPDGLFVRYFPNGYQRNRIQVSLPRSFDIERDEDNRITAIADSYGNAIELQYDDEIEPLVVPGDPGVRGCALASIHFARNAVFLPHTTVNLEADWQGVGWTFAGVQTGRGRIGTAPDRFTEPNERYAAAWAHATEFQALSGQFDAAASRRMVEGGLQDVSDLSHLAMALEDAIGEDIAERENWTGCHLDMVKEAWQSAVRAIARGPEEEVTDQPEGQAGVQGQLSGVRLAVLPPGVADQPQYALLGWSLPPALSWTGQTDPAPAGGVEFDPSKGASVPGDTGKQRQGNGGPSEENHNSECDKVRAELQGAQTVRGVYAKLNPDDYATGQDLDQAVINELNRQLNEQGQPPLDSGNMPMATNAANCTLVPGGDGPQYEADWRALRGLRFDKEFGQYIKKKYFAGQPDVIFDAARAHEQVHQNKCEEIRGGGGDYGQWGNNARNHQQDELAAYDEQIRKLKEWLDAHCR